MAKSKEKEYAVWIAMRQRCSNPRNQGYHNYGGRGIFVCARWESYDNFISDMGYCPPGLTIERIDNDKGYGPANCKWATREEQSLNRRNTHKVTYHGVTKTFIEWVTELDLEETLGLSAHSIYCRIKSYKWPADMAFTVKGKTVNQYFVKGEMHTVQSLCKKYNLPNGLLRQRLRGELSDDELVAPVAEVDLFTVDGVTKTAREWADSCGQSEPTTRKWLKAGKPLNTRSIRSDITFKGKAQTLINWAKEWNLDRKDLSRYLVKQEYTMQEIYDYFVLGLDWAPLGITKGTTREPIEFQGKRLYPTAWRERWGLTSCQFSRLRKRLTMQEIFDGHAKK